MQIDAQLLRRVINRVESRSTQKERQLACEFLPSQKEFVELDTYAKGFSGPVGSGKSIALAAQAITSAFANPGEQGILAAPIYKQVRGVLKPALIELLTDSNIAFKEHKSEDSLTILDCRSKILFKSMDEPASLRGFNAAWLGVDELTYCPQEGWNILLQRVRRGVKPARFACWTPRGYDWVYRQFKSAEAVAGYRAIFARPAENVHLPPDFYEQLKGGCDEQFYRQEALGEYLNQGAGQVYHQFNRNDQVDANITYKRHSPILWACDFNVDPMASVIAQEVEDPSCWISTRRAGVRLHVLDELYLRKSNVIASCEEFLARILKLTRERPVEVVAFGDASGNQHQHITGSTNWETILHFFNSRSSEVRLLTDLPAGNPLVESRHNAMNMMLRATDGNIRMRIHPSCKHLLRDLEEVRFKEDGREVDTKSSRELVHISDALGYLVHRRYGRQPLGHNVSDCTKALPGL